MATYKGIKGVKVVTKAADPTASEADGTVWYNSTSPTALKYAINAGGAWASVSATTSGRQQSGACGTVSAAMRTAGQPLSGGTGEKICETYNGTSWTEENDMITGKVSPVLWGTTTAAICATGNNNADNATFDLSETWNGTS